MTHDLLQSPAVCLWMQNCLYQAVHAPADNMCSMCVTVYQFSIWENDGGRYCMQFICSYGGLNER